MTPLIYTAMMSARGRAVMVLASAGVVLFGAPGSAGADFGVLDQWGGGGTGPGQFEAPVDVAVDAAGNTYVVDDVRNDVQKFDASGEFLTSFGAPTGPSGCVTQVPPVGQLCHPHGIAVHDGPTGTEVFVVDTAAGRIQVFDTEGNFKRSWGKLSCGGPASGTVFCFGTRIAISDKGYVYAVDATATIQVFDLQGNPKAKWPGPLCPFGCLNQALASGSGEALVVADSFWGLLAVQDGDLKSSTQGGLIDGSIFGGPGSGTSQFGDSTVQPGPIGIAIGPQGNLYVADNANDRIQAFQGPGIESAGDFVMAFGSEGSGIGEFQNPQGVAAGAGGDVYVADTGNDRVVRLGETSGLPVEPLAPPNATPLRLTGVTAQQSKLRAPGTRSRMNRRLPRSTAISFVLNEPATVAFTFTRLGGNGQAASRRTVTATKPGLDGLNRWRFLGRARKAELQPGGYVVTAVATAADGATARASFRLRLVG